MGMLLVFTLLVILIVPFSSMLTATEGARSRTVHHWTAAAVVATVFFGFACLHLLPADPIDAWGFQAFYGGLSVLTVIAASLFIHLEHPHDRRPVQSPAETPTD